MTALITQTPGDARAAAENTLKMAAELELPVKTVEDNYIELINDPAGPPMVDYQFDPAIEEAFGSYQKKQSSQEWDRVRERFEAERIKQKPQAEIVQQFFNIDPATGSKIEPAADLPGPFAAVADPSEPDMSLKIDMPDDTEIARGLTKEQLQYVSSLLVNDPEMLPEDTRKNVFKELQVKRELENLHSLDSDTQAKILVLGPLSNLFNIQKKLSEIGFNPLDKTEGEMATLLEATERLRDDFEKMNPGFLNTLVFESPHALKSILEFAMVPDVAGKVNTIKQMPSAVKAALKVGAKMGVAEMMTLPDQGQDISDKLEKTAGAIAGGMVAGAIFSLTGQGLVRAWQAFARANPRIANFAHKMNTAFDRLNTDDRKKALEQLGLKKGASQQEIKNAFRKKAIVMHPDKIQGFGDMPPHVQAKINRQFDALKQAYEMVKEYRPASIKGFRPGMANIEPIGEGGKRIAKGAKDVIKKDSAAMAARELDELVNWKAEVEQLKGTNQYSEKFARYIDDEIEKTKTKKAIIDMAQKSQTQKQVKEKLQYKKIDDAEAAAIKKDTGLDVAQYSHGVESEFFQHVLKQHGNPETELARGQEPIEPDDFKLLPEVVGQPDSRTLSKNKKGLDSIVYEKKINGNAVYVEEVRTGKKTLMATTMWKKKSGTPDAADKRPPGLNVQNDTGTKDIIPTEKQNVQEIIQEDDFADVADIDRARLEELLKDKPIIDKKTDIKAQAAQAGKMALDIAKSFPEFFVKVFEPAKLVELRLGGDVYSTVIKGIHHPEAAVMDFDQRELANSDLNIYELGEWFGNFGDDQLKSFMVSQGKPIFDGAKKLQMQASAEVPEALQDKSIKKAIQEIRDFNYERLQKIAGDDITKVKDYFYGIYENTHNEVDRFLDRYYRTTKRMTKKKVLPTVADAVEHGLDLRSYNPVVNLRQEFAAISRLEGMIQIKDQLMEMGKGKYIDNFMDAPESFVKIGDEPIFDGVRADADLARMINNLIATNKVSQWRALKTIRAVNNFFRTLKFAGSAFHMLVEAKQAMADSPYFNPASTTRGLTKGFEKADPIFQTPEYKDYIELGGGHKYSIEANAQKTFADAVALMSSGSIGKAAKLPLMPLQAMKNFTEWMFNNYIPKIKYAKYLDYVSETERKVGRALTDNEKIQIIKEGQNFYGEMNERLFGRSATIISVLRFIFLAPGFAEGNYRTMAKALSQWGFKEGFSAKRSRRNIVNSLAFTATLGTVGTIIMTGKPPKKPESLEEVRDLFKIDSGKVDEYGRRIMIDLLTYDKDYYNLLFGFAQDGTVEIGKEVLRRIGGMKAPIADMTYDLATVAFNKDIYDWKGDKVIKSTDPLRVKIHELALHELEKLESISLSTLRNSLHKGVNMPTAIMMSVSGIRTTFSETDLRRMEVIRNVWELYGEREEVTQIVRTARDPFEVIKAYNKNVHRIMDSEKVPEDIRKEYKDELMIDAVKFIENKYEDYKSPAHTLKEARRIREYLVNFGAEPVGVWEGPEELKERLSDFTEQRRQLLGREADEGLTTREKVRLKMYKKISDKISTIAGQLEKAKDSRTQNSYYRIIGTLLEVAEKQK